MTTSTFKSGKRAARDRLKAIEHARSPRAKATAGRHADVSRDELAWPCARAEASRELAADPDCAGRQEVDR